MRLSPLHASFSWLVASYRRDLMLGISASRHVISRALLLADVKLIRRGFSIGTKMDYTFISWQPKDRQKNNILPAKFCVCVSLYNICSPIDLLYERSTQFSYEYVRGCSLRWVLFCWKERAPTVSLSGIILASRRALRNRSCFNRMVIEARKNSSIGIIEALWRQWLLKRFEVCSD